MKDIKRELMLMEFNIFPIDKYVRSFINTLQRRVNKPNDNDFKKHKINFFFKSKTKTEEDNLNTEGRSIRLLVLNSERDSFLLPHVKSKDVYFAPVFTIKESDECNTEEELSVKLLSYGYRFYEYIYDMEFKGCCTVSPLLIDNVYNFYLVDGKDCVGEYDIPRKPAYPVLDSLLWWNFIKAIKDKDYAKTYVLGDKTLESIKQYILFNQ